MQQISSFHKFILEIQQSPKTKKARPNFDHHQSKIITVNFGFSEFLSTHQKLVYSMNSFLRYSQFQKSETRVATPIFDDAHPIFFDQFLIPCVCIKMQKRRLFHHFVLEIKSIQKSYNRTGRENFGPDLRNQIFLKYEICARIISNVSYNFSNVEASHRYFKS